MLPRSGEATKVGLTRLVLTIAAMLIAPAAQGQKPTTPIPPGLTTPDKVDAAIGALEYKDGAPSAATVQKVYDNLLYVRGVDAFMNSGRVGVRDSRGLP